MFCLFCAHHIWLVTQYSATIEAIQHNFDNIGFTQLILCATHNKPNLKSLLLWSYHITPFPEWPSIPCIVVTVTQYPMHLGHSDPTPSRLFGSPIPGTAKKVVVLPRKREVLMSKFNLTSIISFLYTLRHLHRNSAINIDDWISDRASAACSPTLIVRS